LFSKGYRKNGITPLTDTLRVYKIGDYVDIKVNSAVHAGMPHKWYHGKTGIIWNVTKRAVGVEVNKQVRIACTSLAGLVPSSVRYGRAVVYCPHRE
jgi:large subunit ribosomal protein L21e